MPTQVIHDSERNSISLFDDLGMLESNISNILLVYDDGTQGYSLTNPDTKEQVIILFDTPNRAMGFMKDGRVYMLADDSGKSLPQSLLLDLPG